ncbi:hypothetical protein SASPL_136325 [Salvia splendens]|uniref:F-box and leucine-rich repeat protein 2/20 n=1 Tax=Salvia splendens TaxID=180675 RepID=A0A8X8X1X4_SALSN|nr:hypothetical protein SASPL_136325 [Salvia splendens]
MEVDGNFESCLKFAIIKKAEIIHIVMYGYKDLDLEFLRHPSMNNGLQYLKDLSLCALKLTDQDFELLISNCIALESLTIKSSLDLKNVSIVGLSKLKRLNLSYFMGVDTIVIRDNTSLVSLTLYHLRSGCIVQLSNTPKLTKLNFHERFGQVMLAELLDGMPSCIRDQLQVMHLSTSRDLYFHNELLWVDLVNIKHLELELDEMDSCPSLHVLRHYCRLVEACSSLDKLVIKFPYMFYNKDMIEAYAPRCKLSPKYLEIIGYLGTPLQSAFAMFIINNARSLERVTVMTYDEDALARARHDFQHLRSVSFFTILTATFF